MIKMVGLHQKVSTSVLCSSEQFAVYSEVQIDDIIFSDSCVVVLEMLRAVERGIYKLHVTVKIFAASSRFLVYLCNAEQSAE